MKKKKKVLKVVIITVVTIAVVAALALFAAYPAYVYFKHGVNLYTKSEEPEVAREEQSVDYNPENGDIYVNDEVIVVAAPSAAKADIEAEANKVGGKIISALDEIGFYKIRFDEELTYDEITSKIKKLKKSESVTDAYINYVFEADGDDAGLPEVSPMPAYYPADPWNDAGWDMSSPRGENWGVEAIRAPSAWGYMDELSPVNVGLIDSMVNTDHEDLNVTNAYLTLTDEDSTEVYSITAENMEPSDHGSHVAGTIAASWNDTGVTGIAGNKASLYYSAAYYVRDGNIVSGYYDAFNYVAAIRALVISDVKAINISQNTGRVLGFAASRGNNAALTSLKNNAEIASVGIKRLIDAGYEFVICVAAGNSNSMTFYEDPDSVYGYSDTPTRNPFAKTDSGDSLAIYNNFLNLISDADVKSRIIVVGSAGLASGYGAASSADKLFEYSDFSNVGSRVDVTAPGEDIYSSYASGYDLMSGTSMATPHVTGIAALVFAANPELTGAEVKNIILASTYGRFCYTDGYSGMADAERAVIYALESRDASVNTVIKSDTTDGLDLCFIVDTTGSMGDDIGNAKENMTRILEELTAKTEKYRVALIDYRDFPERSGFEDYPAKVELDFENDPGLIKSAIDNLDLGNGGDYAETVYSALAEAIKLNWRPNAKKAIILLGDAPPLDPEPYTDYTLQSILTSLYNAKLIIDSDETDDRVLGDAVDSLINVYSIGTSSDDSTNGIFTQIAEVTGGKFTNVDSADQVSDAIISSIGEIKVVSTKDVSFDLGKEFAEETVEIYKNGKFLYDIKLDGDGKTTLRDMNAGDYKWSAPRLMSGGDFKVAEKGKTASVDFDKQTIVRRIIMFTRQYTAEIVLAACGVVVFAVVCRLAVVRIGAMRERKRELKNKAQ